MSYRVHCITHGTLTDHELQSPLHYTRDTNSPAAEHETVTLLPPKAVTVLLITSSQSHPFLTIHLKDRSPFYSFPTHGCCSASRAKKGFLCDNAGNTQPLPSQSSSYHPFQRFHHQISRLFMPATCHIALTYLTPSARNTTGPKGNCSMRSVS